MEHGKKKMEKKKRTPMMYGRTPMKGGGGKKDNMRALYNKGTLVQKPN